MDILLIGNGFDLAHGLPTKYTDFLVFCKIVLRFMDEIKSDNLELRYETLYEWWINDIRYVRKNYVELFRSRIGKIKIALEEVLEQENDKIKYINLIDRYVRILFFEEKLSKEIIYMIENNFWVGYFLHNSSYQKENWIDFENEISAVIQLLDKDMNNINNVVSDEKCSEYIDSLSFKNIDVEKKTYKQIRDKLLSDLNKFIRLFEIYLCKYVQMIEIKKISPDIESIIYSGELYDDREDRYIDKTYTRILNFNYTHVYKWVYLENCKKGLNEIVDYIHGEVDINNTIESNNMVLGIDEYLSEDRKNKDVEFIGFKKYYQRLHKGTGCKYKEWLDKIIRENKGLGDDRYNTKTNLKGLRKNPPKHNLYIFGHSLDVTDRDILREFILTENVYTTIFYRSLNQKGQQIANLVKVIGQDELIRRTGGGSARTIEFKLQQPMEERK